MEYVGLTPGKVWPIDGRTQTIEMHPAGEPGQLDALAHFAPAGSDIGVVRRTEGREYAIRLYVATREGITRIDQLLGRATIERLNELRQCTGGFGYFGYDRTDGQKTSGLRVFDGQNSNYMASIIYGLAEIVHGDARAWKFTIL